MRGGPPAQPVNPRFTFVYDGKRSSDLLPRWRTATRSKALDKNRSQVATSWTDPTTGLVVRCVAVRYSDSPKVEWTLYFKNGGKQDTPIIEGIQALDLDLERGDKGEFLLHHNVGSPASRSDYGPLETPLGPGASKRIAAAGGRPTNTDMSYFNLDWGGDGMIVVVGWPGQWAARFERDQSRGLHVVAGQELTHFRLHPGEEVRSPLIVLQRWKGDWIDGQNGWRRCMTNYGMPKPGGQLPKPMFLASSSRAYGEMIGANEANQIMHIDRYREERLGLDYWWMDAGWYIQDWGWPQVGTWEPDPKRFPHGFKPISDHAHQGGQKILVWFEPERVAPGTWLATQHPEWLLSPLDDLKAWRSKSLGTGEPCVVFNQSRQERAVANIRWAPQSLSAHPGPKGEYAVVRWTAPKPGEYQIHARFTGLDGVGTTTDVHVLAQGRELFGDVLNLNGKGRETAYQGTVRLAAGEPVDFVVGYGNGSYTYDTTGLSLKIDGAGIEFDGARDFSLGQNPTKAWTYGYMPPASKPDSGTFRPFDLAGSGGDTGNRLLDLGNPTAWRWLVNHVDGLIKKNGIDLYRQDFNFDPLPYWQANDAPDRQGITEIKHVVGYLAYWDELRRRHPNMLIDSCASGGRRNDLETMRRAVPLWRSDYAYEPVGHQCMTYGISMWLPYHGTGTVATVDAPYYGGGPSPVQPYAFWSNAAPSLGCGVDIREKGIDYAALRRLVGSWRELSKFYYGDFYPLTPYSQDEGAWIGWQYNRPENGDGAIQIFRRARSGTESMRLKLRGLDPKAVYRFRDLEGQNVLSKTDMTGADLMSDGLPVTLVQAPGASAIEYAKVSASRG